MSPRPRGRHRPQRANIPLPARKVLDEAARTISPVWSNITAIAVALITAVGASGAAAVPHWLPPPQQFDCVDAREKAISIVKESPEVTRPYTGEEEKRCDLNAVVQQVRDGAQHRK